ncbi:capsule assembly Wzi family protein [Gallaecimonas pentaromativorans]|uniref:Capsule assembly protein Wzi n=1 Tax=Gallaecimonas pentaromativorans TaxID=584787 RepID=A0A3N1P0S9_9GAMM|nr:capsule assembly Wzi family protein [Gallaecimonas pentaromativorans]ROQ21993.1 capsule assembly protein Wzi [Gallaecimonas pentaromativorans]
MLLRLSALASLVLVSTAAAAKGVSPYLPLNQYPELEHQVERAMAIAGRAPLKKPYSAAEVQDALPAICGKDQALCGQIKRFLERYKQRLSLTQASLTARVDSGDGKTLDPNQRGLSSDDNLRVDVSGYWQFSDYGIVTVGGQFTEDNAQPVDTMLSLGFDWAQLDIGYRSHWYSPMHDSAMLLSTQAENMPGITLSNTRPLTDFNIRYEFFVGEMSYSSHIAYQGGYTAGKPKITGLHLSMEPLEGWSIGFNRIMQFGGGARGGNSLSDIGKAFFNPTGNDNTGQGVNEDSEFGNQAASVTTQFHFDGDTPFNLYFEYAGEDTSHATNWRLGNVSLSGGLYIPRIADNWDLTYEFSEWQNSWYVHHIYQDGLSNKGVIIGHWGASERQFGDGIGAQAHTLILGWTPSATDMWRFKYRTLQNQGYSSIDYSRFQQLSAAYSTVWRRYMVGGEVTVQRDVFGDSSAMLSGYIRW